MLETKSLEDVLKVQMRVALATKVAATRTKPAYAGYKTLTLRSSAQADFVYVVAVLTARHFSDIL
ncbi:MAG: hypothetical protein KME42_27690, partial [Tildeniella nuda ZEHNDER 1965/U140]|nr:hypothetical protein [Tildeniella nuda ZEHNDER 1965/U140]